MKLVQDTPRVNRQPIAHDGSETAELVRRLTQGEVAGVGLMPRFHSHNSGIDWEIIGPILPIVSTCPGEIRRFKWSAQNLRDFVAFEQSLRSAPVVFPWFHWLFCNGTFCAIA